MSNYSSDSDLQRLVPDIFELGISNFQDEHARATIDINRTLRNRWWSKKGINGEMDTTKLTSGDFARLSSYLVLWKYALPQLTNWVEDDRFLKMIDFYKARYNEEFEALLQDGIEYDKDGDNTVEDTEKVAVHHGRLFR